METPLFPLLSTCFLLLSSSSTAFDSFFISPFLGVHPLDEKYFSTEVIKCKDGSTSFNRDRLNDNYCDCIDGTDEPGTSACPAGKFYCRNLGSKPQFIFSSHVNDRICDCCDGSDEYDGNIRCPNTCIMGGNLIYKSDQIMSADSDGFEHKVKSIGDFDHAKETKSQINFDLIQKLKGLEVLIILQLLLICCGVGFWIFRRRARSRRRRYR
ncbi:hypothetical protein UlMin_020568 [Ulmus minor]